MHRTDCFTVVSSRAASEFPNLPVPVRNLLKLCDGTRTLDALSESSAMPRDRVEHVLRRLLSLGVVAPAQKRAKERRRTLTPQGQRWLQAVPAADESALPSTLPAELVQPVEVPPAAELPPADAVGSGEIGAVEASLAAECARPALQAQSAGFSDDEERFFASPIDHLVEDF